MPSFDVVSKVNMPEVENALAGAPGVFEAAVVGVPNEVFGETVGAVLVPIPGTEVDPAAVVDVPHFCAEQGHALLSETSLDPAPARAWLIRRGG